MKMFKKLTMGLTAAFAFCLLFANVLTVQAYNSAHTENKVYVNRTTDANGNYINQTKFRIGLFRIYTINLDFPENAEVTNVKANKSGMDVKLTYYNSSYDTYSTWDAANKKYVDPTFKLGHATISYMATKAGIYKISFNVGGAAYTVNVLATEDQIFTKAVLGKKKLFASKNVVKKGQYSGSEDVMYKVSDTKGKLKFTPGTKYKITGFVVRYVDKNGKEKSKKYKNGKNIKLSQAVYRIEKGADGDSYKSPRKETQIYISYKDTFTGNSDTYSVVKNRGKKEVKLVSKKNITKINTVSYNPDASLTLWNY
jgi:hypothetical protein